MTWLTWRLQRNELALLGLMIIGLVGMLLLTRGDVVALNRDYTVNPCPNPNNESLGFCFIETSFLYKLLSNGLPFLNFLPLIAALLLALPIVMELENGSYRLAWTQGITRSHWTRIKVGALTLCGLLFAAIFAATFHWWSSPKDALQSRLGADDYDFRGTLPVAHTLFAIGLMLALGTVLRRPIAAIAIGSVAYVAIRVPFMVWARERLVDPVTAPMDPNGLGFPAHGWPLLWHWQDAAGNRLSDQQYFERCSPIWNSGSDPIGCEERLGLTQFVTYHPNSHYWPLQLIESGLFLGAALALIGFSAWYILRRVE